MSRSYCVSLHAFGRRFTLWERKYNGLGSDRMRVVFDWRNLLLWGISFGSTTMICCGPFTIFRGDRA